MKTLQETGLDSHLSKNPGLVIVCLVEVLVPAPEPGAADGKVIDGRLPMPLPRRDSTVFPPSQFR